MDWKSLCQTYEPILDLELLMVEFTRKGGGSDNMMDYLHLVKWNHEWFIVNVLWELLEGEIGLD